MLPPLAKGGRRYPHSVAPKIIEDNSRIIPPPLRTGLSIPTSDYDFKTKPKTGSLTSASTDLYVTDALTRFAMKMAEQRAVLNLKYNPVNDLNDLTPDIANAQTNLFPLEELLLDLSKVFPDASSALTEAQSLLKIAVVSPERRPTRVSLQLGRLSNSREGRRPGEPSSLPPGAFTSNSKANHYSYAELCVTLKDKVDVLSQRVFALENELAESRALLDEQRVAHKAAHSKGQALATELATLRLRSTESDTLDDKSSAAVESLTRENDILRDELDRVRSTLSEMRIREAELTERLAEATKLYVD